MPSKCVLRRLEKVPNATRVAFAASEVVDEAFRRSLETSLIDLPMPEAEGLGALLRRDCRYVGLGIEIRGRALRAADRALDAARAERRRKIDRRQELLQELYDGVVDVRRRVESVLGRQEGRFYFRALGGATSRDPEMLRRQARFVAARLTHPETALPRAPADEVHDWDGLAGDLLAGSDALRQAHEDGYLAEREVQLALRDQRQAIEEFDHIYLRGARYLESLLLLLRLPTLAAQVRPGVGRRGRPPEVTEVDVFPDLVERALRMAGVVAEPEVVAERTEEGAPEVLEGGSPEDLESAPGGGLGRPGGDRKIVQGLRKLPGSRKIIVRGLRKLPAGDRKSEQGLYKLPGGHLKSEQGLHKLEVIGGSIGESTVGVHRQVPERRVVLGLGNVGIGRRVAVRTEASGQMASAPIVRLRETASTWWGRQRRAA